VVGGVRRVRGGDGNRAAASAKGDRPIAPQVERRAGVVERAAATELDRVRANAAVPDVRTRAEIQLAGVDLRLAGVGVRTGEVELGGGTVLHHVGDVAPDDR